MATTNVPLQSIELTSNTSSVTLSNIPQNYKDLILVTSIKRTVQANTIINFNGDSATGSQTTYSSNFSYGTGINIESATGKVLNASSGYIDFATISTEYVAAITHINNYSNSTTNKSMINRAGIPGVQTIIHNNMWRNTSPINSITLTINAGLMVAGSTISLYGVSTSSANNTQAFGGTEIFYDSSFVYHVFKASGTFTPNRNLTADILVVAGGGGSGGSANVDKGSGGGGAGGLLGFASQSLTTGTSYTVTVGAGGSAGIGSVSSATQGVTGSDSQFGSLTLVKGGGGGGAGHPGPGSGSNAPWAGLNGGSGGGSTGGGTAGTATSGQGNNGGASADATPFGGSGGGGAGAAGQAMGSGGAGGVGSSTYSSWGIATSTGQNVSGTVFYAGGGGGGVYSVATPGVGGSGGGGTGGATTAQGSAGITNTGGGAGGTGGNTTQHNGNSGGSGLVIVRYAR